jgi:AcrR family transcriptional regulator
MGRRVAVTRQGSSVGRPLSFDPEIALDAAVQVFWARGYDGASIDELSRAMGLKRPSVYNTFGSKADLFCKVVIRYESHCLKIPRVALSKPHIRDALTEYVAGYIDVVTDPNTPQGCLEINGAVAGSVESEMIRRLLVDRRQAHFAALSARLDQALMANELREGSNTANLADYIITFLSGAALQAKAGVDRDILLAISRTALAAIPFHP